MFQIKTFDSRAVAPTENLKRTRETDAYKVPIAFKRVRNEHDTCFLT